MHSHHSHSGQFCKHAAGTLEHVVLEAISQGFEVYGLTEHIHRSRVLDLYPEEKDISVQDLSRQFEGFIEEAHRLKIQYADQITLLVGLETEYITKGDLETLSDALAKNGERIQYIVGSVHHVNEIPIDFDLPTFERCLQSFSSDNDDNATTETFFCSYFDAQYHLLHQFHPEIIGHLDLCRLYNPHLRFAEYPQAHEKLMRNIQFAVEYGALFEVNAAAFRKGWDAAYPGEDVIQLILNAGGRFALSDDSHGPHAVGLNYHRLAEYLRRVGVQEIWYLEQCNQLNIAQRKVQPIKVQGNWWEHSFWTAR